MGACSTTWAGPPAASTASATASRPRPAARTGPAAPPSARSSPSPTAPPTQRTGRPSPPAPEPPTHRSEPDMAVSTETMTDEQRKSVALEYLKAFDNGGVTSTGDSILELFATDAQVMFPKWGIANGREEIGKMFGDVGSKLKTIRHDYANFNWIFS